MNLNFYSKLRKYVVNEEEDWEDDVDLEKGHYTLLEIVEKEWFGDKNRGLANYISKNETLNQYVKYIHYHSNRDGYICFDVEINASPSYTMTYRGEEMTLKEAVAKYIKGQVSDGWGENGVYVIEGGFMGNPAIHCNLSYELYEKDGRNTVYKKVEI